jgi:hypothetical protein
MTRIPRLLLTFSVLGAFALAAPRVERRQVVRDHLVFDCGANYKQGKVSNAMASNASSVQDANGLSHWEVFLHPPAQKEQGRVRLVFAPFTLPKVTPPERLEFRTTIRIRADITGGKAGADGVLFVAKVNGQEVLKERCREKEPRQVMVDLGKYQGQKVTLALEVDMVENSAYDQASWGQPRIVVAGRKETLTVTIPIYGIEPGEQQPTSSQAITVRHTGPWATVLVAVPDRHLDLDAMVKTTPIKAPVPLSPRLVTGEGPDPQNHTVVRILGPHGIPEVQFLAFPPEIRGGVQLEAGRFLDPDQLSFVAAANSPGTRELRLFNQAGGLASILLPRLAPPYAIAAGRFLGTDLDQVAAVAANCPKGRAEIAILNGQGDVLQVKQIAHPALRGELSLGALPDGTLLIQAKGASTAIVLNLADGTLRERALGKLADGHCAFPTVYGANALVTAGPEAELSHISRHTAAGVEKLNVGARENRFWFAASGHHAGEKSKWGEIPEAEYFRPGRFAHIRVDMHVARQLGENPELRAIRSFEEWQAKGLAKGVPAQYNNYDTDPPTTWEPCFTHRWIKPFVKELAAVNDEDNGLPRYLMLDRNAKPVGYSEFDGAGFTVGTYTYGLPEMDSMYTYPVRHFMRGLAVKHRANPEHFIAVEPNHEHEITSGAEDRASVGDYHPANLTGFLDWLHNRFGSVTAINTAYSTEFSPTFFDAPRGKGRGDWDRYDKDNPLFQAWFQYNARVISRRVADTWREALLAGMPPESITCHQIPDSYAISSLGAFSKPVSRVTPIDWMLTAGTSYGFTRYSVWYKRKQNCIQGSWSSGFGMVTLGEYSALATKNEDAYGQLRYLHEHGAMFIHCMWWPSKWEKGRGYNDTFKYALRRMAEEDRPRMGVTGGVSTVRPYRSGDRQFDIVALGTGPKRTGLIKSVREDGSWEGSVYVAPFHAHVAIDSLFTQARVELGEQELATPDVTGLTGGSQLETTFRAAGDGTLHIDLWHDGHVLPTQRVSLPVQNGKSHRVIHRFQNRFGLVRLLFSAEKGTPLADLQILRHRDRAARIREGEFEGTRHRGGVTFAILE